MKNIFWLWLIFGLFSEISGQSVLVTDAESNEPLEWVTVQCDPSSAILNTNEAGRVSIASCQNSGNIEFSLVGYKTVSLSYQKLKESGFIVTLERTGVNPGSIVVSATRWNQNNASVPSKILTVSPKEVALQNPQTAADLLGLSGRVFIQKSQQGGGSPMIRGFAANRLIYSIDGVRMNTAIFRGGNIQNVINMDPFMIEKTEVVLGPGSVLYGSDAIGGTMAFRTITPTFTTDDKPFVSGKFVARYSSANTEQTGHFHVHVGLKKWALVTGFTSWDFGQLRQGNHGPDDYIKPIYVTRLNNVDEIVIQENPLLQIPTAYKQKNFMQKIRFSPDKNWDFGYAFHWSETSSYGRYDRHNQYRNGTLRYAEWDYGPQLWDMHLLSVEHKQKNVVYDKATLKMARQFFGESRIDRILNSNNRNTQTERVTAWSTNLDFVKSTGTKNQIFYGVEYVFNKVSSSGFTTDINSDVSKKGPSRYPDSDWGSLGIYVQDMYKISEKWTVLAGARYNKVQIESDFANNLPFYPLPFTTASTSNGALTGSLGAVYRVSESFIIKSNVGTAFRSPNVDDLGKFFDSEPGTVTVPNPDLRAEQAYNVDLGFSKVFGEVVRFEITGYYTVLQNGLVRRDATFNGLDSILYDGENSKVQANQNAAVAHVYGVEGGVEIKFPKGFRLTSDINYQVGEEELEDGTVSPSRHAAPLFGVTRLTYQNGPLTLMCFAQYQGRRDFKDLAVEERGKTEIYAKDVDGNNYAPAWYTLNLKAMYNFSRKFSVSAGLENITDQRYRPYSSGVSGAGRNFVLSGTVMF